MKRFAPKLAIAILVYSLIFIVACSTAWITTLDDILTAAAPALINILNIIDIAKGLPLDTATATKITADAATIRTLGTEFADASASAAPTACAQLQAAIGTYSADQSQVLSLANGLPQSVLTEVTTLSALVAGTVTAILDVIPNCAQAVQYRAQLGSRGSVPLPLKSFVHSYNDRLVVPTGVYAVDTYTKSHKVHVHSVFLRKLSFGLSY